MVGEHPVERLCEALEVSRSGFYAWHRHAPSIRVQRDQALSERISRLHARSRSVYGSPRIHRDLVEEGVRCGRHRVARLMRQSGLRGAQKRRLRPRTTDSRHRRPVHPNRLALVPAITGPNEAWVSDLTYIPTQEGWLYLAAFMDLGSRRIVGWALRDSLHTDVVLEAFRRAVAHGAPPPGLIVHSDRGIQYASEAFRNLLKAYRFYGSMSRIGNVYDNAAMESFWATLKTELPQGGMFPSKSEARLAIFDYIEGFYNRWRRHSALGYLSPLAFEAKFRHESTVPFVSEKAG
jgi:transposase InsO family protein